MPKQKGFTLMELMIATGLMVLLATVGISVFSGAMANARDSKRKADINAIADAMEANYGKFSSANYTSCNPTTGCNPATKYSGLCQTGVGTDPGDPQYNCSNSTWPWFAPESGYPNGRLPQDPINAAKGTPPDDVMYKYFWCTASTNCSSFSDTDSQGAIVQGAPPAATTEWYICASLEKGGAPYCRNNRQGEL